MAADVLAKYPFSRLGPSGWIFNPPPSLLSVLSLDAVGAREGIG